MKVLFFLTPRPRMSLIFQIQAELILKHVFNGDEICIVRSSNAIFNTQVAYQSLPGSSYLFNKLFSQLELLLQKHNANYKVVDYYDDSVYINKIPPVFANVEELKKYSYKGFPIGVGVASSLISFLRDHEFNLKKNKKKVSREIKVAMNVLDSTIKYLDLFKPDEVYFFNGRTSSYQPVYLCCKKRNVDFNIFELTGRFDKFHLIRNAIPHDIEFRNIEMNELWDLETDLEKKEKIAKSFFDNQRKGISLMEGSFLAYQKENEIPKLDFEKEIITFFNSSIDEFASVAGWEDYIKLYEDEVDAIYDICNHFAGDLKKQFVLRVHPNLKFLKNTQNKNIEKLRELNNLLIIEPQDSVSSYSLLEVSSKVITFGSTVGVEACYFGKPVIVLGLSLYKYLDVAYEPSSKSELYQLIDSSSLLEKPKENTYKYGYWRLLFGNDFIHRDKGVYFEKDFIPSKKDKVYLFIIKLVDVDFWRRVLRNLKNPSLFLKKLKNPTFINALKRNIMPWIKR